MEVADDIRLQEKLKQASNYLIYLVLFLALSGLFGWQFEIDFLKRPLPHLPAMNPTTSVLFILSALSFLFSNRSKKIYFLTHIFTGIVFVVALIKLGGALLDIDTGIDRYILTRKLEEDILNKISNSMAPNTAFCFIILSAGIPLLHVESSKKRMPSHFLAIAIALIALLSIIGYVYHVQAFRGILSYIPMAFHTATGFLLFSMAILLANPDKGLMKELTSQHTGSETARFLIPFAIVIPILLGYFRLLEYWFSTISTEFSVALLMLSIIVIFVSLIWNNSISLNKKDALRKEAEEKLELLNKELEARVIERTEKLKATEMEYRSLIEEATDGIFISDNKGFYTDVNPSACKMLGYTKEELLKLNSIDILLKEDAKKNPPRLDELRAGKNLLSTRTLRKKDGSTIPVEITGKMLLNGKMLGMVRDITERKKAEAKLAENEILFRQTLDNMLEGIQIHDSSWRYTYVNDSLVKYSHYKKEELLGYTLMEKYPGIEQTELFKTLERCMVQKVTEHFETEFTFPNGTKAYFELSVQPIPTGLFILSIDITERKKAEDKIHRLNEELEQKVIERTAQLETNIQQLKESEEKFQKAFQLSAAGITITRLSDSRYLDVNDAFVQLTGYSKEEAVGHTSLELGLIVANTKKREEILQHIRENGSIKQFEITIKNKFGRSIEVLSSTETIYLNGEKYAINIIFDITDRKIAQEQLEAVNKELEAFSYSISHDLRAPLRAIDGYAKILEEDYKKLFDSEGNRLLGIIQDNALRMSGLIDDLLEFSRLGRKTIQKTVIDMNLIAQTVAEEIRRPDSPAEIKIENLLPSLGDYALINQVLINLISNALKYSSKKNNPLIEISSEEKKDEIVYCVRDNGAGFDMQYVDKLFGVFQRLHSSKEFEGTGVGLAIVQRIIIKHGGKVWAEGMINEGASFYFTLPKK